MPPVRTPKATSAGRAGTLADYGFLRSRSKMEEPDEEASYMHVYPPWRQSAAPPSPPVSPPPQPQHFIKTETATARINQLPAYSDQSQVQSQFLGGQVAPASVNQLPFQAHATTLQPRFSRQTAPINVGQSLVQTYASTVPSQFTDATQLASVQGHGCALQPQFTNTNQLASVQVHGNASQPQIPIEPNQLPVQAHEFPSWQQVSVKRELAQSTNAHHLHQREDIPPPPQRYSTTEAAPATAGFPSQSQGSALTGVGIDRLALLAERFPTLDQVPAKQELDAGETEELDGSNQEYTDNSDSDDSSSYSEDAELEMIICPPEQDEQPGKACCEYMFDEPEVPQDEDIAHFVSEPQWIYCRNKLLTEATRAIRFSRNMTLTNAHIEHLLSKPWLCAKLRHICYQYHGPYQGWMSAKKLEDRVLVRLARACPELRTFVLAGTGPKVTSDALVEFCLSCPKLRRLEITGCKQQIADRALSFIATCQPCLVPNLEILRVHEWNNVTNVGRKKRAKSFMREIQELSKRRAHLLIQLLHVEGDGDEDLVEEVVYEFQNGYLLDDMPMSRGYFYEPPQGLGQ